jgi:hypothetical protein
VKYIAAQIAGGIAAGLLYSSMAWKVFNLAPAVGFGWVQAFFAEAIYTFMLCFVVLNVAASKWSERRGTGYFYGLAIGFVIVVCMIFVDFFCFALDYRQGVMVPVTFPVGVSTRQLRLQSMLLVGNWDLDGASHIPFSNASARF